ncbi:DUF4363 family protein [uncultured Oscillibacter sp.]|jgi:hypothetical protein|uniref:DUF4363 family protein n=1 Tax=uncultured Oscillibacter sp. TaxID=876091 RepID=UPI0025E6D60C|nr:DUF4363 family protein [uncultured Oscillibacter sp.]
MKGILPPLTLLAVLLAFALWNGGQITDDTARWRTQLQAADTLAQSEDWAGALSVLSDSYADWSRRQTYLHIVSQHSAVDEAESMYCRCQAFAATQELSEFRAETAGLREQLRLLAEMERFSLRNIL